MYNKRIELHLHTKLSDDISVIDVEEIIENAKEFDIEGIAFTNLSNVQDFPKIEKCITKKTDNQQNYIDFIDSEIRFLRLSISITRTLTCCCKWTTFIGSET